MLNRSGVVQGALGEPHVEVSVELGKFRRMLIALQDISSLAERNLLLVLRQFQDSRLRGHNLGGQIANVFALIAVFGNLSTVGSRHQRGTEVVHLDTSVI